MSFYIVTGKLRGGKSLICVSKIKEALLAGRRVATNLDINIEHMLPVSTRKIDLTRIPDLPTVHDLNNLGQGSEHYADESQFGLLVIDEGSGNFNSRTYADENRQAMIDWLKHSGKLRWHVYIIVQSEIMLDKQIREAFGEHLVICKRSDRFAIPVIGPIFKLIGITLRLPKVHIGTVRYGLSPRDPVVDRWFYKGHDLYKAYDTEQRFVQSTSPGLFCYLSPYTIAGFAMNKFQIAKSIAASYVGLAFLLGLLLSWSASWWMYKGSQVSIIQNGSKTAKIFDPQDADTSVVIDGVMFVDNVVIAYLNDGRVIKTKDYVRDAGGIRIKISDKWVYKKD